MLVRLEKSFPVTYENELKTCTFLKCVQKCCWKWLPPSPAPHQSQSSADGGEGLMPEPQVAVGLCSHSLWLRRFSLDMGNNFFTQGACAVWEQAARGSCCLRPWLEGALLDRASSWGEPHFPGRWVRGSCASSVPGIQWGQLQCSAQLRSQRRHQDPYVVTDPQSVKRSSWSPQQVTATTRLSQAVPTSSSVSFTPWHILSPYPEALRKCFACALKVHCLSDVVAVPTPILPGRNVLYKEQTSSLKWLKLLTKMPSSCWQNPRDRVYQQGQALSFASNFSFFLQALRNQAREERNRREATK